METLLKKPRTLKEFKAVTHAELKGDLVANRYKQLHARLVDRQNAVVDWGFSENVSHQWDCKDAVVVCVSQRDSVQVVVGTLRPTSASIR